VADTFNDERDDFDDAPRGHVEPHRGVLILVLGIMGFIVCGFLGVAAWLMGKSDLEKMKRGEMDREGEALTRVGYILGLIETILMLVSAVVGIVAIVLMFLLRLK
jgi:hypothetical protein